MRRETQLLARRIFRAKIQQIPSRKGIYIYIYVYTSRDKLDPPSTGYHIIREDPRGENIRRRRPEDRVSSVSRVFGIAPRRRFPRARRYLTNLPPSAPSSAARGAAAEERAGGYAEILNAVKIC